MKNKLVINGLIKLFSGIVVLGLLLFLPAGTFHFAGAWRMITILFVPMLIAGTVLYFYKPDLLSKRLNSNETESEQKTVILYSSLIFVSCFILCGFDYRFGWSHMPLWMSIIGCLIFILTYLGFIELLRENEYLSRTVEVQEGQKVISTGLYGIVRHPMYAIIFWMFISMPIVIGSYVGLIPLILLPAVFVKRILNEETVLANGLPGYTDYMNKVKYRIIPFIW